MVKIRHTGAGSRRYRAPKIEIDFPDPTICILQPKKMSFIQNLSVFIPRIHREDANEEFIKRVFYEQEIACVRRIDFLKCRDSGGNRKGNTYYQAKLYFHYWFKNQIAYNIQQRVLNPDNSGARVIYADPWYWMILKTINPMTELELCVNERLEYLSARSKKTKAIQYDMQTQLDVFTEQIASLQTDVDRLKEQAKTKIPQNTHIRFCYFEEPSAEETVNVSMIKNLMTEETANECAEAVLQEEEPTTPEWNDYYDQLDAAKEDSDDYEKLYPTWNVQLQTQQSKEAYCEGCELWDQGLGGENQVGHTCNEPTNEFEILNL